MILAAARRFALLLLAVGVAVTLGSAAVGLLTGSSLNRAISLGFYLVGAFFTLAGFATGNRGPVRPTDPDQPPLRPRRGLRAATLDELQEAVNTSVLLVVLGLVLIAVGLAIDSRTELV